MSFVTRGTCNLRKRHLNDFKLAGPTLHKTFCICTHACSSFTVLTFDGGVYSALSAVGVTVCRVTRRFPLSCHSHGDAHRRLPHLAFPVTGVADVPAPPAIIGPLVVTGRAFSGRQGLFVALHGAASSSRTRFEVTQPPKGALLGEEQRLLLAAVL